MNVFGNFQEVVAEATHRTGITDLATRAEMYARLSQNHLDRALRTQYQRATAGINKGAKQSPAGDKSPSFWEYLLPDDSPVVRQPISMYNYGTGCRVDRLTYEQFLASVSSYDQRQLWASRFGPLVGGWILLNEATSGLHMTYYTNFPDITNWDSLVLQEYSDIILQTVIFQGYTAAGDHEKAGVTAGYLDALVETANADALRQMGMSDRVILGGPTP